MNDDDDDEGWVGFVEYLDKGWKEMWFVLNSVRVGRGWERYICLYVTHADADLGCVCVRPNSGLPFSYLPPIPFCFGYYYPFS